MATYRIYPIKDTTIIENSEVNTGQNEVAELWYGVSGTTRHLIKFDVDAYQAKQALGIVPHVSGTTATLNLTNCYPHEETETTPAESVAFEVFASTLDFSEGIGNEFTGDFAVTGTANWTSATDSVDWTAPGGDRSALVMFTGTIDAVDDSLVAAVDTSSELITMFTGTNNGVSISYTAAIEADNTADKTVFKFYSNDTHTLFKPYIELTWDDQIRDERNEVLPGTTKRIYFYVKKNGVLTNVNAITDVTIRMSEIGEADITITTINNPQPGVYYVDFTCPTVSGTFTDTWDVQYEAGMAFSEVAQNGEILDSSTAWSTDLVDVIDPDSYNIMIPNFKSEFKQGEYVYLDINAVEAYTSNVKLLKNLEYSIDLLDGYLRTTMIDWSGVSYSEDDNFIRFDSSWLPAGQLFELKFRHQTDSMTYVAVLDRQFRVEE